MFITSWVTWAVMKQKENYYIVFDLQICIIICVTHSIGQRYLCVCVCVCTHTRACVCKCNTIQYNEDVSHYIIHTVQVIK